MRGQRSSRNHGLRMDVVGSVLHLTGLTSLSLESESCFTSTPACILKLTSLQRLTHLKTTVCAPCSDNPIDLAEFAQLTGMLQHYSGSFLFASQRASMASFGHPADAVALGRPCNLQVPFRTYQTHAIIF